MGKIFEDHPHSSKCSLILLERIHSLSVIDALQKFANMTQEKSNTVSSCEETLRQKANFSDIIGTLPICCGDIGMLHHQLW